MVFPELDDLVPLFSDQQEIHPEATTRSLIQKLSALLRDICPTVVQSIPHGHFRQVPFVQFTHWKPNRSRTLNLSKAVTVGREKERNPGSEPKPTPHAAKHLKQKGTTSRQTTQSQERAHNTPKRDYSIFQRANHPAKKRPTDQSQQ